jgi:hypothetical protein
MTTETASYGLGAVERLWLGRTPPVWGDVVRIVPDEARDALGFSMSSELTRNGSISCRALSSAFALTGDAIT